MSSDLIDHLMEQAHNLTPQQRRLLITRLLEVERTTSGKNGVTLELTDEERYRNREQQWLKDHGAEYAGLWVALDGELLISSGTDGWQVFDAARKAGIRVPFVVQVESPDDLPFGGW